MLYILNGPVHLHIIKALEDIIRLMFLQSVEPRLKKVRLLLGGNRHLAPSVTHMLNKFRRVNS